VTRHRPRPAAGLAAGILPAFVLAGCASQDFEEPVAFEAPETLVSYEAEVAGAPSEEMDALLRQSLLIFRRQEDGAQSLAFLRRRARGDIETAEKILRSYGYYRPTISVEVWETGPADEPGGGPGARPPGHDPGAIAASGDAAAEGDTAEEAADEEPGVEAVARLVIDPGQPFILARHNFRLSGFEPGAPPALGPAEAYGSPVGAPAAAAGILEAENAVVAELRRSGRPYAERGDRDAVIDLETTTMEVETMLYTGRAYRFGPVRFEGNPDVEDAYLLTYLPWEEGEEIDAAKLAEYQRELLATGLFRSGTVTLPDEAPEGEAAPVTVKLSEAPFRTVAAGARYDSDDGPAVRLRFEHRNLFGANEQFRAVLDAGIEDQILTFGYTEPQFLRPGQDFVAGFEVRRESENAYDDTSATLTAGLTRELTEQWTVGAGGLLEASFIEEDGRDTEAYLAGLPVFAAYDGSNDLLNPTRGGRARLDATPFTGIFDEEWTNFLTLDAKGSYYQPLDAEDRYVLALRGRAGSILSESFDRIPATRRLYSGGSGSVRAFAEDFVGPLDENGDPLGGRSVLEFGAEMRARVWGDIGVVGFVEGGTVSQEIFPDFEDGFQYGVGAGVRYYSPVGPIRLDVAVPLDPREEDDSFQFYISIGQAF
jgi:translocation and assembly module TamA